MGRQQALKDFSAAVAPRLDHRLEINEETPVGEYVRKLTDAKRETLEEIGAWLVVLWDRTR